MQPRKLTMRNFGPFIDEALDFQDFENTGIFLISGKTGSGKTTIFDGMTYALFGQTSGKLRSGKEMRSLFASPAEETEVTFDFEHGGVVYQIQRRPEQVLNKKRGSGQTTRAAKTVLTVFDDRGEPKEQFTKNVDAQISELLHLTADQFFKIIMLPQGEFRNFLIASSLDKEQVLRKLFDTEIYQDLNEWLKQLTAEKEAVLAQQQARGIAIQEYFRWSGEAPESLSLTETSSYWEADLTKLKEQRQTAETALQQLDQEVAKAEQTFYAGQELQQRFTELQELEQRKAELSAEADTIRQQENEATGLAWLKENRQLIQNVAVSTQQSAELAAQLTELRKQLKDNEEQTASWQGQRAEMAELAEKNTTDQQELTRKQGLLPLAEKAAQLVAQQQELAAELAASKEAIAETQQTEMQTKERLAELTTITQQQEAWQQTEIRLVKLQQALQHWQESEQRSMTAAAALADIEAQEQTQIQRQETLTAELVQAETEHKQLKSDNAKLQIARLSLELLPGEPCPVCGSLEHPQTAESHGDYSYETIQASETALAASEKELTKRQGQIAEASGSLAELHKRLLELEQQSQQEGQATEMAFQQVNELYGGAATKQELPQLIADQQQDHEALGRKLKQAQTQRQELEQALQDLAQHTATQQEQQQAISSRLQGVSGQAATLQEQLQGVTQEELTKAITTLEETIQAGAQRLAEDAAKGESLQRQALLYQQQQEDRQQQAITIKITLEQQQAELDRAVEMGPSNAAELLMADTELALQRLPQLTTAIKTYRDQQAFVERRLAELQDKLAEQGEPQLQELETALQELRQTQKRQQEENLRLQDQESNNRKLLKELQKLIKESQEQLQELSELQQLRDTINGKNAFKTSLERYVLQAYLAEILEVANQRLQRLSKGRYQFELAEKELGGRGQKGLDIDIYDDDAGATRRVQTLSGGESFIAALALALSLADVIQNRSGGIPIEALFIDEGFGSLDEEALEMALEALASIEAEGRMIGIISHVGQLKERITRQVLVEAEGTGQSHIHTKL